MRLIEIKYDLNMHGKSTVFFTIPLRVKVTMTTNHEHILLTYKSFN